MSWLTTHVISKGYLLWMASQGIIKSRYTQMTRNICHFVHHSGFTVIQRYILAAMSIIFRDHIQKTVKYYIDDISVKSYSKDNHLHDLKMVFDIMRADQLKMNPTKSFLGVQVASFFNSSLHPNEFILTPTKPRSFKVCSLWETLRSLEVYKTSLLTFEDSSQICHVTINQSHG